MLIGAICLVTEFKANIPANSKVNVPYTQYPALCRVQWGLSAWLGCCAVVQQNQLDMEENTGDTRGEVGDRNKAGNKEGSGEYLGDKPHMNKE